MSRMTPSHRNDIRRQLEPRRTGRRVSIPLWFWALMLASMCWAAISPNPVISLFSLSLLPVFWFLLWRRSEPPVLLFACAMQWLQAAAQIFYSNAHSWAFDNFLGGPELELASWLSLFGVLVGAIGMRLALTRSPRTDHRTLLLEAQSLHLWRLFYTYVICFALARVLEKYAFRIPGLAQVMFGLINLKWIPAFLLAYAALAQRRGYGLLAVVVALEFGSGMLGFFSNFKSIFFLLLVVTLGVQALQGRRNWAAPLLLVLIIFVSNVIWTSVKVEYRSFLNQGTGAQP